MSPVANLCHSPDITISVKAKSHRGGDRLALVGEKPPNLVVVLSHSLWNLRQQHGGEIIP